MKPSERVKLTLDNKLQKVLKTPASFDFYIAIHDFIECVELNPVFAKVITASAKSNQLVNVPRKYGFLKQIYQGLEDIDCKTNADLGHERYSVIRELSQIRNNDLSDGNSFWKKREMFRKLAQEIHGILDAHVSAPAKPAKKHQ